MRATIRDVAKRAGVSTAAVSYVINDLAEVSEETRRKVLEVIAELNYQPNRAARELVTRKTGNLGLIVFDDRGGRGSSFHPQTSEVVSEISRGIERTAERQGYSLILSSSSGDETDQAAFPRFIIERRVDGFMVLGSQFGEKYIRSLKTYRLPLVLVSLCVEDDDLNCVMAEDIKGAYYAVKHLLRLGHREIALIGGPSCSRTSIEKKNGYLQALREAGIPVEERIIHEGDFSLESGGLCMEKILTDRALDRKPTALFAADDRMAVGAMRVLSKFRMKVPEDFAVVGYYDSLIGRYAEPPLTTVRQPKERIGEVAARRLMEIINTGDPTPLKIQLPVELVIRESCGIGTVQAADSIKKVTV